MDDADRLRLLFGPYATPPFRYGDRVRCAIRGEVEVVGLTDAPIPWPVGKRGRQRFLVLFDALADAVRREAAVAVARWWGVSPGTVLAWRRALGVGAITEGTRRMKADSARGSGSLLAAQERSRDPEKDAGRREKIRAALEGKPKPRHVVEAATRGRIEAAKGRRAGE